MSFNMRWLQSGKDGRGFGGESTELQTNPATVTV